MDSLIPIEHKNQRVLTTAQLAEFYGTESRRISENFNSNANRFEIGKTHYPLSEDLLREFKNEYGNSVVADNAKMFYLWTEKGALLHAKSLNTDKAWEVYQELVDTYFRKQIQPNKSDDEIIMLGYTKLMDKVKLLQGENTNLNTENQLLTGQTLTWANRNILNAIIKAYGSKIGFEEGWRDFKKELIYRHGININLRVTNRMNDTGKKTKPRTLDMIHDDELSMCISTAVALCKNKGVDISEIINKYKAA